ncbi:hypothetical protein KAJ27_24285, partial [bacterium]|nr:hypothetical protein [bacterium]
MIFLKRLLKVITILSIVVIALVGIIIFSTFYYINNHYLVSEDFNLKLKSELKGIPLKIEKLSLSPFSLNVGSIGLKDELKSLTIDNCKVSWDIPMLMNVSKRKPFKISCKVDKLRCSANIPEKLKAVLPLRSINCLFAIDPRDVTMISSIEGNIYDDASFKLDFKGNVSGVTGTLNFRKVKLKNVLKNCEFKNSDKVKAIGHLDGDFIFKADPEQRTLTVNGISSSKDFIISPDLSSLPPEFAVITTFIKEVKVNKIIVKDLVSEGGIVKIDPPIIIETDLTNINISGFWT